MSCLSRPCVGASWTSRCKPASLKRTNVSQTTQEIVRCQKRRHQPDKLHHIIRGSRTGSRPERRDRPIRYPRERGRGLHSATNLL